MSSKSKNQPLPSAFEQALNTGKIGGQGKREESPTEDTANQQTVNTDIQQTVKPAQKRPVKEKQKEPESKPTTTQEQQTPAQTNTQKVALIEGDRKIKQTILISEDLATRVKMHAAKHKREGETIANITTKALEEYLAKYGSN